MTRRTLLRAFASSFGLAAGVGLYTWRIEPHWLEVVNRTLPVKGLPSALAGRSLVQLSDIHVGDRVADAYILATFQTVSALKPDIVVLTGDMMSYHEGVFDQMSSLYQYVPRGTIATLAILGNHDYGPNWSRPALASQVVEVLEAFGVRFLRNEVVDIGGLQVVGLDDLWAHRFDPTAVLASLASGQPALALSHNPDTVDLPVWGEFKGWILSGHTHGGQCKPPFLPPPLLPVQNKLYTEGIFELSGERSLYISRGVGHQLQVRFNVRPEITVFELQAA